MNAREALEIIKSVDIIIDGNAWHYTDTDYKDSFDIISTALTELECLKEEMEKIREVVEKWYFTESFHSWDGMLEIDKILKGEPE